MAAVIEHESTGANVSISSKTRSTSHPYKTVGSGANFVRHYGGAVPGPTGDGLLTEGGDYLLTEDGAYLILE